MAQYKKEFSEALIKMLEADDPISINCPRFYMSYTDRIILVCYNSKYLCGTFLGTPPGNCPCFTLGCKRAVKRAWLWLEEEGFI